MFGRKKRDQEPGQFQDSARAPSGETDRTLTPGDDVPSKSQIKRATRPRYVWTLICSFLLLLTVVFMILVEVGCTDAGSSIRDNIYFLKLDLTNIFPTSVPDSGLDNTIAQTLGLHDYYQVGLWSWCEGYTDGITDCSKPVTLYWFDPVAIILDELLAGATITLPAEVTSLLGIIKIASHFMFGCFLSGVCLSFVMLFLQPLSVYSRWAAFGIAIFTFLAALLVTVGAVIATIMFVIFRNALTSVTELNIGAKIGTEMFAFMWIASGAAIIAWLIQMGECCCCASRRDVRTGRKRGSKKAWNTETVGVSGPEGSSMSEKPKKRGLFGRK